MFSFFSPFNVHPKSHYVLAGTKVEFKVGFRSMHLGNAEGELQAVFETGWCNLCLMCSNQFFTVSTYIDTHSY